MYFDLIILMVVFLEGWERPWMISKTFLRRVGGTQGRGVPVLTSHRMAGPSGRWMLSKMTDECRGRGGGRVLLLFSSEVR